MTSEEMTIELALLMLFEGNLYDDKGYVSDEGYKALETLEGVTLTRNIETMEDDAKQASIPYSYQEPKDYIKNKLDYSRPQGEHKCVTCKYRGCGFTEKPCRECSRSWADLYEEAEND